MMATVLYGYRLFVLLRLSTIFRHHLIKRDQEDPSETIIAVFFYNQCIT